MIKLLSLSVFFPCLNDAKSLPSLLQKTYQVLPKIAREYEVIIINDGSTDNTKEITLALSTKYPHLRQVNHLKNKGYGRALISGFKAARKSWIFYTDGDGQYNPQDIIKLVKKVSKDIDVVNGYKLQRKDSFYRTFLGKIYNDILHRLYKIPVRDVDCDFRLIKRKYLKNLNLQTKSGLICLELILKLQRKGAKFSEVGVNHYPRKYGKSQFFKLKHIWPMIDENIKFFLKTPWGH